MYGVIKLNQRGDPDFGVSSGPFVLLQSNESEISLERNPRWFRTNENMAQRIIIRKPPAGVELQETLLRDEWPNLVASHSLMEAGLDSKIKERKFHVWQRDLDRTFWFVYLGKKTVTEQQRNLFLFLSVHLNRETIVSGLKGYTLGNQVYPRGYSLFDAENSPSNEAIELPPEYKNRSLKILLSPDRVSRRLKANLTAAIEKAHGKRPVFIEVPIGKVTEAAQIEEFDFYIGSVGVADANIDGAMSYYFEMSPTSIPSGEGRYNFAERLRKARAIDGEGKRVLALRSIICESVLLGHALPLFHFSTNVMAKPEIDLSRVPVTDETVSFSKVRFTP